jgi:hypothetical protein
MMHFKKVVLLVMIFFITISCNTDDSQGPGPLSSTDLIHTFTNHGLFRISTLIEDGDNKTAFFGPYTFLFEPNNVVTAQLHSEATPGTYSIFVDDGRIELRLLFPGNPQLNELNDDWYFSSQSENAIKFEDSGDLIEFTKL